MPVDALFPAWQARIERALESVLPAATGPTRLEGAMRHAVLGGGKRLRPLLVFAAGRAFGAGLDALDAPAISVELLHAFSLVHDDLPAMDDDVLRRGRPTVHMAYDEATAILAGDALQALAFGVLADAPLEASVRIALVRELAAASGISGMCAGQSLDMEATGRNVGLADLEQLHGLKTGALIRASVRMGALAANAPADAIATLDEYSRALGLAFQIRDDILDVEGDAQGLGKTAGKDAAQGKSTYPSLVGVEESRRRLAELRATMQDVLRPLGAAGDALQSLAAFSVNRQH